jgi:hypothetical protein
MAAITIEVDETTAKAFADATPAARRKMTARARIILQAVTRHWDKAQPCEASDEEVEHVRRIRPHVGKITREECG